MTKEANPVGRPPTQPSEFIERCEKANKYLFGDWKDVGDVVPSIAGLACYLGKNRDTIYQWAKENENFSDIISSVMTFQENQLVNRGLDSTFNPTITKLMLTKHGYSDKIEQEIKAEVNAPSLTEFYAGQAVVKSEP